jgi:hypothetical protein
VLKIVVTEAINEHPRVAELATDRGKLHDVLSRGNAHANYTADHTLQQASRGAGYFTGAARWSGEGQILVSLTAGRE